jgi:hypothetical protein
MFFLGEKARTAVALDEFETAGTGISDEVMARQSDFVDSERKTLLGRTFLDWGGWRYRRLDVTRFATRLGGNAAEAKIPSVCI